jgi:hypothetical protein
MSDVNYLVRSATTIVERNDVEKVLEPKEKDEQLAHEIACALAVIDVEVKDRFAVGRRRGISRGIWAHLTGTLTDGGTPSGPAVSRPSRIRR